MVRSDDVAAGVGGNKVSVPNIVQTIDYRLTGVLGLSRTGMFSHGALSQSYRRFDEMLAKGFALEIPAGFGSQKSRKSRKSEDKTRRPGNQRFIGSLSGYGGECRSILVYDLGAENLSWEE
jgi:hypothetical protein